ncbi:MAG: helix-turn-helix domain-containing protein [Bacteroides sp.]|nr:helix-turn-helix domain-containing protein [Bacteroides sp.]
MARDKIKSATDQRHYSLIYHDSLDSDKLDGVYERMLFIALKRFADSNNQCFPSIKTLKRITGMSRSCIIEKLDALEKKGIIKSEPRIRSDGGQTSNIYTIYDYADMWKSKEEGPVADADQRETQRMIEALEAKGFTVSKEKEPDDTAPTKVADTSDPVLFKKSNTNNNTRNEERCQEVEEYSVDEIKRYYNYAVLVNDCPEGRNDFDSVMNILHDALNTSKQTIRIDGEDKPRMVVVSKLLKLTHWDIRYAVKKYQEQTDRIKNPRSYMLTILYHASEQGQLDVANQVAHDMAHRDDDK